MELGKPIDARVDVWSMGCVLYALAFGRSPFESPTEVHPHKPSITAPPPRIKRSA